LAAKPYDSASNKSLMHGAVTDEDTYLSILTGAKTCSDVAFSSVVLFFCKLFFNSSLSLCRERERAGEW
jgi:hypothetical protein